MRREARFLGWRKDDGEEADERYIAETGLPNLEVGEILYVDYRPYVDSQMPYFEVNHDTYLRASEIEVLEYKPLVAEDWL